LAVIVSAKVGGKADCDAGGEQAQREIVDLNAL
jgi:hypothetical protein